MSDFPDTIQVPKSTVVYEKLKEGQAGYNAKKPVYKARGGGFKDAEKAALLWTAHKDKNTDTIYFYNSLKKETVWVLPDLESDGGSAAAAAASTPAAAASPATPADAGVSTSPAVSVPPTSAAAAAAAASKPGFPPPSPAPSGASSTAEDIRAQLQAKLQAKMAGIRSASASSTGSGNASPITPAATAAANTTTAPTAPHHAAGANLPPLRPPGSPAALNAAVTSHASTPAVVASSPLDVSIGGNKDHQTLTPRGTSASASGSWRDRFAQRHGRSPTATPRSGTPTNVTPQHSPSRPPAAGAAAGSGASDSSFDRLPESAGAAAASAATAPQPDQSSEAARYAERRQALQAEQQQKPSSPPFDTSSQSQSQQQQQQRQPQQQQQPQLTAADREAIAAEALEQQAETERIRAARLELQVQQRRALAAEADAAAQSELDHVRESRRQAEARRLELELARVQLLSEKQAAHEKMLASLHRGDADEVRAAAEHRLEEAREVAQGKFHRQQQQSDHVTPVRGGAGGVSSPTTQRSKDDNGDEPVDAADTTELDEEVRKKVVEANQTIDYGGHFVYKGDVKKGTQLRHGTGTFHYGAKSHSDGRAATTFEGEWRDGVKRRGVQNLASAQYEGDWLHDRVHGRGTLRTRQLQASAPFQKGVAHGNGAVVQIRGHGTYTGPLRNNKAGSHGSLSVASRHQHHHSTASSASASSRRSTPAQSMSRAAVIRNSPGSAKKQQQHQQQQQHVGGGEAPLEIEWKWSDPAAPGTGEACATFADGNVYVGAIRNFTLSGPGRLAFAASGDEYVGEFVNNTMHGKGLYRFAADGSVYDGDFENGAFQGVGKFATNTFLYEGEWRGGMMHGAGRIKYDNDDVWEGTFENHRRCHGRYTFSSVFALEEAVVAGSG